MKLSRTVGLLLQDLTYGVCGRNDKDFTVRWGKMSMVGQSRSLGILFCMPKIKELIVKRSTFLLFYWNTKSKIDDPVIISSLPFTPETKMSSDSPTLPYKTFVRNQAHLSQKHSSTLSIRSA